MRRAASVVLAGAVLLGIGALEARSASADRTSVPPEAVAAVRSLSTLLHHVAASDADPRFTERLPATPDLIAEIRGAVVWERHLGERTEVEPVRVEVLSAVRDQQDVLVRTREYLVARTRATAGGGVAAVETRAIVGEWEYRVARVGARWLVADWKPLPARSAAP